MFYAICSQGDGKKWVILRGWNGCLAGQGNILMDNVDEQDLESELQKLRGQEFVRVCADTIRAIRDAVDK